MPSIAPTIDSLTLRSNWYDSSFYYQSLLPAPDITVVDTTFETRWPYSIAEPPRLVVDTEIMGPGGSFVREPSIPAPFTVDTAIDPVMVFTTDEATLLQQRRDTILGLIGDQFNPTEAVSQLILTGISRTAAKRLVFQATGVRVPDPTVLQFVTIDDFPGLRERLDSMAIDDLDNQIDSWYMTYPHDIASQAVRDLLGSTLRKLPPIDYLTPPLIPYLPPGAMVPPMVLDPMAPPIIPYVPPIDPLQVIDMQVVPPIAVIPPVGGETLPPADSGVEVPPAMAPADEGSLLPLGVGAIVYLLGVS